MVHDPLSPSEALRTKPGIILGILSVCILLYSLVIVAQILVGGFLVFFLTLGVYGFYRLFAVLDALADAQQRIAATRERESKHSSDGEANHDDAVTTQNGFSDDVVDNNE
ncbi:MAG: hypothetical protein J07HQX50_00052 [Haloquadratum sp. J07HQX50]|jgi:hypothetical protein|nr:MAG: hypothetical protein J07HQX50_00052 [Haloquadratum sp. J07HQX50]